MATTKTKKTRTAKTVSRTRVRPKKRSGLMNAAVEAAVELGHAAESLKDSMSHVGEARKKGRAITKKVGRAVSKAKKKVIGAAKRVIKKRPKVRSRKRRAA